MKKFLLSLFFLPSLLHATVTDYGSYPTEVKGTRAEVTADGILLDQHKQTGGDYDFVRFELTGSATIQVAGLTNTPKVLPVAANITPIVDTVSIFPKTKLTFTITKPGTYIVPRYDETTKKATITYQDGSTESAFGVRAPLVVIFAEAPMVSAPQLGDPGVKNATTDFAIQASQTVSQTANINNAIDSLANSGGGTLFFPAGAYLTGMIQMRDKVHLFLDKGACLLGNPDNSDIYGDSTWSNDANNRGLGLIVFDRVKNSSLRGHGSILDKSNVWTNIRIRECKNIQVEGILINNLNVQCDLSDFIEIKNLKTLNDLNGIRNDSGPIINSSRHVKVESCSSFSSDDGFNIGSRSFDLQTIRDITFKNCIAWSNSGGFRHGGWSIENYWDQVSEITLDHFQVLCGEDRVQIGASGFEKNWRFLESNFEVAALNVGNGNFGDNPPVNPWTLYSGATYYRCTSRSIDLTGSHIGSDIRFQEFSLSSGPFATPTFTAITTNDAAQAAGCTIDSVILFQP